jgi:hypothetical protein
MQGSQQIKGRAEKKRGTDGAVCAVLAHPMRVHILEVLNEGPKSPSQFVAEGLVPPDMYRDHQQALSLAAYHFRELEKAGCLEVIESIPRRGALEHVYRGLSRVYFTDEEFEQLPLADRRRLSRISFQGLIARTARAMQADTFDSRADRHLTWMPFGVDARGWEEMIATMTTCFGEIERIRHEAENRLAASGEEKTTVTFAMLGFESPSPPSLPASA